MNFWQKLKKPIFILAPMEDVTDTVFRQIIMSCGRPDVFFTEFTNVDGMFSKGDAFVTQRLQFNPIEKPIVAQIWGMKPENYFKAAKRLVAMGFDGIDINMGCPQKSVVCKGACSALINNHALVKEIILATKEGAGDLPVSVKTRLGFKVVQTDEWINFLLEQNLDAVTIHGRTAAEMSAVPAHWDEIGNVVQIRNKRLENTLVSEPHSNTKPLSSKRAPDVRLLKGERIIALGERKYSFIIGNGDVRRLEEAEEKVLQYGVDGVMIGRGIFHNPWLFDGTCKLEERTIKERVQLLKKHIDLYEDTWHEGKSFQILKKYFKMYISEFDGAAEMRAKLMETNSIKEVKEVIMVLE